MEIKDYISAGYPYLWITTPEWEETLRKIKEEISTFHSYSIYEWNIIEGWKDLQGATINRITGAGGVQDPIGSLLNLPPSEGESIYIMINFHHYIKLPPVIQFLLTTEERFKSSSLMLIFISVLSNIDIPPELQNSITILDDPLPNQKQIEEKIDFICDRILKTEISLELREKLVRSSRGLTLTQIENSICLSYKKNNDKIDISIIPFVIEEKKQLLKKTELLEYFHTDLNLQNIGGLDFLKEWLSLRKEAFSEEARKYGLSLPKGLLLVGIPGTGKSLVAKCISYEWQMPLIRLDVGRMFNSLVGQSEQNVRSTLKIIDSLGECIVWLDEIEKGVAGVSSSGTLDSGVTARVMGTILTWMQEKTSPSFIVATANDVEKLPPELLRKGRWDEIFFIDLPTREEREEIFKIHIQAKGRNPEAYDISRLAGITQSYTGAEIEAIVNNALFLSFSEKRELEQKDLEKAVIDCIPLSKTMKEKIIHIQEWASGRAKIASGSVSGEKIERKIKGGEKKC